MAKTRSQSPPFATRLRSRREELRLTREELRNLIEKPTTRESVSVSTLKAMERLGELRYRLPKRKPGAGPAALDLVASALGVPVGYFLAGFPRSEVDASMYGEAVRAGKLPLVEVLRSEAQSAESFAEFLCGLPGTESELLGLPLHTFKNERAFAVVARIERIYEGLEMLVVNEPPLIFWDEEDVDLWMENMQLEERSRDTFRAEFAAYKTHFRGRAKAGQKSYKVVLNSSTFHRFLSRKNAYARRRLLEDMQAFVELGNFGLLISHVEAALTDTHGTDRASEAHECEVLCKTQTIPATLAGTVSVQIMQTPPHRKPVGYFVSPVPRDLALLAREISRIDGAWAATLDSYREVLHLGPSAATPSLDAAIRDHTRTLLRALAR